MVQGVGFVIAGRLALGNAIVTRAGPALTVAKIEWKQGVRSVYNFEVEEDHAYFVGSANGGLWVHNIECTLMAKNMQKSLGCKGEIYRIEPTKRAQYVGPRGGYEDFTMNRYHDVLIYEGRVYDPMMEGTKGAKAWVDKEKWMERWDMDIFCPLK